MLLNEEGYESISETYFVQRYTATLTLHIHRTNAFPPIVISILLHCLQVLSDK